MSNRKYRQENPEKEAERKRKWRQENPEKATESNRKSARKWRQDNREKELERKRKWREANPEYHSEYHSEYNRKHRENNPDMHLLKDQRRRARKLALPYDLTADQQVDINATFGNACALTGDTLDIHADHVIPLSIGHGGTTYGNMIPLSAELNLSKRASHIFEWFEANRNRFNLSQRKFDALIEYLAQVNEMTTREYRAYVDWCFDNPRDVGELQDAV